MGVASDEDSDEGRGELDITLITEISALVAVRDWRGREAGRNRRRVLRKQSLVIRVGSFVCADCAAQLVLDRKVAATPLRSSTAYLPSALRRTSLLPSQSYRSRIRL